MKRQLASKRAADPKFYLAGDGVHPGAEGHWIIAKAVLEHLGASDLNSLTNAAAMVAAHTNGPAIFKLVQQKQRMLKDAWLTDTRHLRLGMKKGLPLGEAQQRAAELDKKIRELGNVP
jgi:phospholipase/lecithinase/hemolysin